MNSNQSRSHAVGAEENQKLCALVDEIKFALFTTAGRAGQLHSFPMTTQQVESGSIIWFFADAESPRIQAMKADQQVCLNYASPSKQEYVSISGRVQVLRDRRKAEELWSPFAQAWFPLGVDDPKLILLRVVIDSAEYWDSPSSSVVQLYGVARAVLTGETPKDAGEHVKVR